MGIFDFLFGKKYAECSGCGSSIHKDMSLCINCQILKEAEKRKPNEHKCYKCGINASLEGYMCTPCAKETAKQMKDDLDNWPERVKKSKEEWNKLSKEEKEESKKRVEKFMKEQENIISEKISLDSEEDDDYQILDEKIDKRIRVHESEMEDVGIVSHYKGKPFTGVMFYTHENGNIKLEHEMQKGLKDGKVMLYNEDGQIITEGTYKKDKQEGGRKSYYENKLLREYAEYRDGELHGECKQYYPSGQIESLGIYDSGQLINTVLRYPQASNFTPDAFNQPLEEEINLKTNTVTKIKKVKVKWINGIDVFESIEKDIEIDEAANTPYLVKYDDKPDSINIIHLNILHAKVVINKIILKNGGINKFKLIGDDSGWEYLHEGDKFSIGYLTAIKCIVLLEGKYKW